MPNGKEMLRYRCHKIVWALKIAALEIHKDGSATIAPVEEGYGSFKTAPGWADRFTGGEDDTGYYVVYPGGFASWSPTKAFEDGYTVLEEDPPRQDYPRPQTRGEYLVEFTQPGADDTASRIQAAGAALIDLIDGRGFPMDEDKGRTGNGEVARCKATAITSIEQGVMWAVKAVTKPHRD